MLGGKEKEAIVQAEAGGGEGRARPQAAGQGKGWCRYQVVGYRPKAELD